MQMSYMIAGAAFLLCLFFTVYFFYSRKAKPITKNSLVTSQSRPKVLQSILPLFGSKIDEKSLASLEEKLIQADIDLESCQQIIQSIQKKKEITSESLQTTFLEILSTNIDEEQSKLKLKSSPSVLMFVGVNGVGKTSTVGKLASKLQQEGKSVCLVPADTYRAGAIDQLKIWSKRANCQIIDAKMGEDPAAVVYRGIEQAQKKKTDVVLIDTAGRLHNNNDLMLQLKKIVKITKKLLPSGIDETIVVLDGCLGQNSLAQLQEFDKICSLSGVAITKLDGSAKGGVIFGIQKRYKIPVKLVGMGEQKEDLIFFEVKKYVQSLL